jgi:short-subunit dehydrogenase
MNEPRGTVLMVGATSGIGRAVARRWALAGQNLILAARDETELSALAADLTIRFSANVRTIPFDALNFEFHAALFQSPIDTLILCHGYLALHKDAAADPAIARTIIDSNFTSAVSVLNRAADYFEARGRGTIIAITSVAGDRGRQSNYIYGSAKAALQTYLQGLRHRLAKSRVKVIDVRPGFVDTAMTWGLPGAKGAASPEKVAADIYRAARRGRSVVYTPWFWRWIMLVVRLLPEFIFHRTRL